MIKKKQCYLCHKTFEMEHFILKPDQYGKERYYCKINLNKSKNVKKIKRKGINRYDAKKDKNAQFLKYRYNLTIDDFNNLIKNQNNKCKICNNMFSKNAIDIDHNHLTNKIRGLLCPNCNTGIGLFCDNATLLKNAITYLNKYI